MYKENIGFDWLTEYEGWKTELILTKQIHFQTYSTKMHQTDQKLDFYKVTTDFPKILGSTIDLNINKMLLEQQNSVSEWFLKDHVTLKTAEFSFAITGINYILKYITIFFLYITIKTVI